jgi:Zn-dependent M28 family amino/carboxypeptidase
VVIISAHIDSWDVGQGAHDDGAGCVIVMQALTTLKKLGLVPKRTVRVVLFTNEENGLKGGTEYAKAHAEEAKDIVAALESDFGGYAPDMFTVEVPKEKEERALALIRGWADEMEALGHLKVRANHGGADIGPLGKLGVPGVGFGTKGQHYFDIHHSVGDTLDKVDPKELSDDVAAVAAIAWLLADSDKTLRDL